MDTASQILPSTTTEAPMSPEESDTAEESAIAKEEIGDTERIITTLDAVTETAAGKTAILPVVNVTATTTDPVDGILTPPVKYPKKEIDPNALNRRRGRPRKHTLHPTLEVPTNGSQGRFPSKFRYNRLTVLFLSGESRCQNRIFPTYMDT